MKLLRANWTKFFIASRFGDCAQYLPPVFMKKLELERPYPPQMIISLPVQTAV